MTSPSPGEPALIVSELTIRYPDSDRPAVRHAGFSVGYGQVVAVLGPSGCGKSTMALSLSGLIPQVIPADVTGQVIAAGIDVGRSPVARTAAHVSTVFQDPDAQIVAATVLDDVAFGPENLCLPGDEVLARSRAALEDVGLWDRRDADPHVLSGGERQRVVIAGALAMTPSLLVLDEPTANLDAAGTAELYETLARVRSARDLAIVLVEHNLDAAVGLLDRVVVMDGSGAVVADGSVDEVLRGRAAELESRGVWLPTVTVAALRLRRAGYRMEPLPLTASELTAAVAANPAGTAAPPAAVRLSPRGQAQGRSEPILAVRDLRVVAGGRTILDGVSLGIAPGQFVAIVGPNGAGKTTLLQAMAGVTTVPRGTVTVAGRDISGMRASEVAALIGFVFQNPEHQFITETVYDELVYGLRGQGMTADRIDARVTTLLQQFGLTEHARSHPFTLSGGQKRRLSVGTAIVTAARVLALDEPTFGQDRAQAVALLRDLRRLADAGVAIVIVSHDLPIVAEYADRVIVMADGTVRNDGPPAEVLGDSRALAAAGLPAPLLAGALGAIPGHPELAGVMRVSDLPDGPR